MTNVASRKPGNPSKAWRMEWETKLRKAPRDCWISDNPAGRLSMACNPDDGLVVPIQAYLLEGALRIGEPWNTVEKHGYHLCIWYDYLRYNGLHILDADERHLRNFLLGGATRYSNVTSINKVVEIAWGPTSEERFRTIVAFYDFWQRKRGRRLRQFRGGTIADLDTNLFGRVNRSSARAKKNFARPALEKARRHKGTPTPEEAEQVLERSLDRDDQNRAQTYYIVGSLAYRSGSRAVGVSSMTVPNFLNGLRDERGFKEIVGLNEVLKNYAAERNRMVIVQTLKRMKSNGRKFIYCYVRNKGGGEPIPIAIPVELAVEIVDYICTYREEVVQERYSHKGKVSPPHIFLSYKTEVAGGFLQPETFSNHFSEIFRDLHIDGSLHRLRATFCEEVVRDIYIRERAVHGRAWQANNVLEFARQLLGHKNPASIEHYLNLALAQELMGDPVLVEASEDTPYIRTIADALTKPGAAEFRLRLRHFVHQEGLEPITDDERRYALF